MKYSCFKANQSLLLLIYGDSHRSTISCNEQTAQIGTMVQLEAEDSMGCLVI